ncbi:MAG: methyltransferase domain-containing protein, partial [Dehalococcoidia bacterium]|nr:methyltransferase domain-containing protein [Dehalococcoidia bacterium]
LAHRWDSMALPETEGRIAGIFARLNIRPGSRVLDIGSGTGVLLPFLLRCLDSSGTVVEMDIAVEMLKRGRQKVPGDRVAFVQGDAHCLPFASDIFDLVICHNTFPHFTDKERALGEMARVTGAGGRVVISHTMSRNAVNDLHRQVGGIVEHDRLPENQVLIDWLRGAGLSRPSIEDTTERYLVVAWKGD